MRASGMLELDSYRLAAYTVPCPCYICGGGNNFDAELCLRLGAHELDEPVAQRCGRATVLLVVRADRFEQFGLAGVEPDLVRHD